MRIPRHIALIPDGNRRWAKKRGLRAWEGHSAGLKVFKNFINWCYEMGVKEITAYSLSKENLSKRKREEINQLSALYEKYAEEALKSGDVERQEVKITFAGDLTAFPKSLLSLLREIEEKTKNFAKRQLNLCLNYSGRDEIIRAVRRVVEEGIEITEESLEKFLDIKRPPDLIIRTAERRLSNFLLWQSAYSEIYFSEKLFPEFTKDDLLDAIKMFNKTERRYGG